LLLNCESLTELNRMGAESGVEFTVNFLEKAAKAGVTMMLRQDFIGESCGSIVNATR
jgi:hypothetical protein